MSAGLRQQQTAMKGTRTSILLLCKHKKKGNKCSWPPPTLREESKPHQRARSIVLFVNCSTRTMMAYGGPGSTMWQFAEKKPDKYDSLLTLRYISWWQPTTPKCFEVLRCGNFGEFDGRCVQPLRLQHTVAYYCSISIPVHSIRYFFSRLKEKEAWQQKHVYVAPGIGQFSMFW